MASTENTHKPSIRNKTRIKITLLIVTLLMSSTWLVYRDTTKPRKLSSDYFSTLSLKESAQAIADSTVEGGAPGIVVLIRKNGIDKANQTSIPRR